MLVLGVQVKDVNQISKTIDYKPELTCIFQQDAYDL